MAGRWDVSPADIPPRRQCAVVSEFEKVTVFSLPLRTDGADRFAPVYSTGHLTQQLGPLQVCAGLSVTA